MAQMINPQGRALFCRPLINASTTASPDRPCSSSNNGAMRNSASNAPSRRASSAASKATRSHASIEAIAATVNPNPSKYRSSDPELAFACIHAARPAASPAGTVSLCSAHNSSSVCGRRPPSRCSCNRILGRLFHGALGLFFAGNDVMVVFRLMGVVGRGKRLALAASFVPLALTEDQDGLAKAGMV